MHVIYLDHNSTTPILAVVREAMLPFLSGVAGNPASAHSAGRRARQALEDGRESIAALVGAYPDEVVFTSGATEANNLAIFGLATGSAGHVVSSPLEHPSVGEPTQQLAGTGLTLDTFPVGPDGVVRVEAAAETFRSDVRLACLMRVNHETGALQPVDALVAALNGRAPFHCDATQAVGRISVNFHELGVTTMAFSAHKFHGPAGIGALLIRRGTNLQPRTWGGRQQQGLRPGTEPVALVVGMARALAVASAERTQRFERVLGLRQRFLGYLQSAAAPVVVNGPLEVPERASPYALNVSFPGCRSDVLLMNLDLAGIACSTGSACSSGSLQPSPVLKAMNLPEALLHSALRFSFSAILSEDEVDEAARRVAGVVGRIRSCPEGLPSAMNVAPR